MFVFPWFSVVTLLLARMFSHGAWLSHVTAVGLVTLWSPLSTVFLPHELYITAGFLPAPDFQSYDSEPYHL